MAASRKSGGVARPSTVDRGRRGERIAADFLRSNGYIILSANYRIREGEIDLIAEHDSVLCFVEVRSRQSAERGHPLETIDYRKRARLIRAARHYLATHPVGERAVRFDVVSIVYSPRLELQLIQGAFDATGTGAW